MSSNVFYYFAYGSSGIVWLGWLLASIMFAVGVFYLVLYCCMGGKQIQDEKEMDSPTVKEQMMWWIFYIFFKTVTFNWQNHPKFKVLLNVFLANPKSEEKVPPTPPVAGCCCAWVAGFWPWGGTIAFVGELGPKSFILILSNIFCASRHTIYPSCII